MVDKNDFTYYEPYDIGEFEKNKKILIAKLLVVAFETNILLS